jgi:hypothetical protein
VTDRVPVLADRLLTCLCDALDASLGGPVCRCCLAPGVAVPMDVCCQCGAGDGQAAVRVAQIYPTTSFPDPIVQSSRCMQMEWAVVLEMVVYRCAATLDDSDPPQPPTCEEVTRDALVAADDAAAMRCAVTCCFGADPCEPGAVPGAWQPIGPSGGCHGGAMQVTVALGAEYCPGVS